MEQRISTIFEQYINEQLEQVIISNSADPDQISKVKIRPVILKQTIKYQATSYCGQKVLHDNFDKEGLLLKLPEWFEGLFKQIEIRSAYGQVNVMISKKGKVTIKEKKAKLEKKDDTSDASWQPLQPIKVQEHNRKKRYIIEEGTPVPFLVDLGIMSIEGKIVHAKYDKFKQINRFLEFIEDILPSFEKKEKVSIIDFGCGKSYLTFAMYYYLRELKGYNVSITGLDLKKDVIQTCNELKDRYGYEDMRFLQGDIASYEGTDHVDMVVTLHACDTATDYAMAKAYRWGAKVILSVPCCQHEFNKTMGNENLNCVLQYGLIKERMAALATDALRANLLECLGYKVSVMEFIDMEHTPKNILVRAVRKPKTLSSKEQAKMVTEYKKCIEYLNVNPTMYQLLKDELD
ncbi:MAG: SAM-dependent methyltransferase [Lachnospiraceae bacterium]|nr:SAM-dependent methyltransferase [Lachnospiraceae bacterium]